MRRLSVIVSTEAPKYKDCLWLKPTATGFGLYWLNRGKWQTLTLIDDNKTAPVGDDKPITGSFIQDFYYSFIGSLDNNDNSQVVGSNDNP